MASTCSTPCSATGSKPGWSPLGARLLVLGGLVVVEFGSWSRPERDHLLSVGRAAGAAVELHVLDPGVEELWRRLSRRNTQPGQVPIDRETLESYVPFWSPPTLPGATATKHRCPDRSRPFLPGLAAGHHVRCRDGVGSSQR